ncbi:TPA: hypothetical protein QB301_001229 [Pasteurella multocida]|nr:hypothetical protein [Pasteurella multocida]
MGSYVDLSDKYDRADGFSGGGGWKEYDSKDREARTNDREYISTRDRMNNHLSRHGSDKDYTRSFNDYSRSSISSLARTTRGNLAGVNQERKTTLTGQKIENGLLANMSNRYSVFNPVDDDIKGPISRIPDHRNPNALNSQNFKYYEQLAEQDFIKDKKRSTMGNTAGGIGASTVAEMAAGLIGGGTGKQIAGAVAGLATSNAGDIANAIVGKGNRDNLNKIQKTMYDSAYTTRDNYFKTKDGAFDTWDNAARSALGGAVDFVTKNPLGAGSTIANVMNENAALEKTLRRFGSKEGDFYLRENAEKIRQARLEDVLRRKDDESNKKGILSAMSHNLHSQSNSIHQKTPYYAIPAIQNLWNNIKVK